MGIFLFQYSNYKHLDVTTLLVKLVGTMIRYFDALMSDDSYSQSCTDHERKINETLQTKSIAVFKTSELKSNMWARGKDATCTFIKLIFQEWGINARIQGVSVSFELSLITFFRFREVMHSKFIIL